MSGAEALDEIAAKLEALTRELEGEPDADRAAELIREASTLASEAGRELDGALRAAAQAQQAD